MRKKPNIINIKHNFFLKNGNYFVHWFSNPFYYWALIKTTVPGIQIQGHSILLMHMCISLIKSKHFHLKYIINPLIYIS